MSRFPQPGPVIHGQQTTIHLLDRPTLTKSPFLEGIFNAMNTAFGHAHPPYIPASWKRLLTPQQILSELGQDSFTSVVTVPGASDSSSSPVIIAACSSVPRANQSAEESQNKNMDVKDAIVRSDAAKRSIPGIMDWEIKQLCVQPEFMKQGLAGRLLEMVEAEIGDRVRKGAEGLDKIKQQTIRLMITTLKELNGPWYQKRGYVLVEIEKYPAGSFGGTAPFEMWHMDKMML